jgi:hypothetical protein
VRRIKIAKSLQVGGASAEKENCARTRVLLSPEQAIVAGDATEGSVGDICIEGLCLVVTKAMIYSAKFHVELRQLKAELESRPQDKF